MTDTPDNAGEEQEGRDRRGRWKPGVSGNPAGCQPGSRHRATKAVEGLLDGRAEALTQKAVEMALKSVYLAAQSSMEDALTFESSLFGLLASTGDMREGMKAFLEKRKPDFTGSRRPPAPRRAKGRLREVRAG